TRICQLQPFPKSPDSLKMRLPHSNCEDGNIHYITFSEMEMIMIPQIFPCHRAMQSSGLQMCPN
ncbi:MAG: hypothetical protein J5862_00825, partial [Bacteroidales bacterium]|nr:hypothetical protein [Bacteroidales bacterium]